MVVRSSEQNRDGLTDEADGNTQEFASVMSAYLYFDLIFVD